MPTVEAADLFRGSPRRPARPMRLRATIASIMMMALLASCASPQATRLEFSLGISPGSRVLDLESDQRDESFEAMTDLGASWVRIDLDWSRIEPESGALDWATTDEIIASARAAGLGVLALVAYTPRWARPEGTSDKHPPNDVDDFEAFVRLAVERYGEQVGAWEIWNEPNIPAFWETGADPGRYGELFMAAASVIHAEQAGSIVVTGGLAPASDTDGELSPITFLTELYAHLEPGVADAIGVHPYSFPRRPSQRGRNNSFQQLPAIADLVAREEGRRVDLWLTEFGAPTGTSKQAVSPSDQAAIISEALRCIGAWRDVGPLFLYNFRDPANGDLADREDNFGLIGGNGDKKPAWDEVRRVLTSSEGVDPCGF